ncbi:MAG: hypothetical protein Q8Q12_02105 [bacterium]|nr:hypothetical protein [bacterium]
MSKRLVARERALDSLDRITGRFQSGLEHGIARCGPVYPLAARAHVAQKRARSAEPTPALERGRGQAVILSKYQ